jgi:hypothetical protein
MLNDTLVTSSGIIKNRSKARVGVVNASSLYGDLFQDCLNDGIDLSWESLIKETTDRLALNFLGLDEFELSDMVDSELQDYDLDSHVFLLGAWVKDYHGGYMIDESGKNGSYALEYNTETGIVCVNWSLKTTKCNNTSPCYVMADGSGPCADLDSKGDTVIGYTLPSDMFNERD